MCQRQKADHSDDDGNPEGGAENGGRLEHQKREDRLDQPVNSPLPRPGDVTPPEEGVGQPQDQKQLVDIQSDARVPAGQFCCSSSGIGNRGGVVPTVQIVKGRCHVKHEPATTQRPPATSTLLALGVVLRARIVKQPRDVAGHRDTGRPANNQFSRHTEFLCSTVSEILPPFVRPLLKTRPEQFLQNPAERIAIPGKPLEKEGVSTEGLPLIATGSPFLPEFHVKSTPEFHIIARIQKSLSRLSRHRILDGMNSIHSGQ